MELTLSFCDGALFIEIRNFQRSYKNGVVDFDLALDLDLDRFFIEPRRSIGNLIQVQVEDHVQVQVRQIR